MSDPGSNKFTFLWLALGICILGCGAVLFYCLSGYLYSRVPHFSSDQSYVLAFVRSTEPGRFAFVSPKDGKIIVSTAASELISGSSFVSFVEPCNLGLGTACFYGYPRTSPEHQYYVYRWQLQDDTVTELVELPGDVLPIGVTAEAVYLWDGRLFQMTSDGQGRLIADPDSNLHCSRPEISPNGRYVAFLCLNGAAFNDGDIMTEREGNRVLLLDLSDNSLRQLTEPGYIYLDSTRMLDRSLAWSPDSTQIAYFTSTDSPTPATQEPGSWMGAAYDNPGSIYSVDLNGVVYSWGQQVGIGVRYFSWSPDNNYLVYTELNTPALISKDKTSRRLYNDVNKISWSPDGAYIALLDSYDTLQILATSDYQWYAIANYRWYAVAENVEDFTWVRMK